MLRKFVVYNLILVEHAEEKADLREVTGIGNLEYIFKYLIF